MEKLLHSTDRFYPISLLYFTPSPLLRDCGSLRIFIFFWTYLKKKWNLNKSLFHLSNIIVNILFRMFFFIFPCHTHCAHFYTFKFHKNTEKFVAHWSLWMSIFDEIRIKTIYTPFSFFYIRIQSGKCKLPFTGTMVATITLYRRQRLSSVSTRQPWYPVSRVCETSRYTRYALSPAAERQIGRETVVRGRRKVEGNGERIRGK